MEPEKEVVLGPMRFRPSKVIETKGDFSTPQEWTELLKRAHQNERRSYRELDEQHGKMPFLWIHVLCGNGNAAPYCPVRSPGG